MKIQKMYGQIMDIKIKRLKVKGCKTHFNEKAYKNKPLTKEQKELNKKKSKIRV